MLTAYEKSVQSADDTSTESFEEWYNKKSNTVPQFKYWDMVLKRPDVNTNFEAGNFVAMKTKRAFSAIVLDQNHEQVNACLKGDGGIIGLTERSDSLLKWLLVTPELAANIARFEEAGFLTHVDVFGHHSDKKSFINLYRRDLTSVKATFESLGNPFEKTCLFIKKAF
ncbi:hypothetical protein FQA39_LY07896 [Lamprigera yunnana]|nr:hypothetical protein FQA39_LY07896 [Lamprigera yunnana]